MIFGISYKYMLGGFIMGVGLNMFISQWRKDQANLAWRDAVRSMPDEVKHGDH